MEFGILGPLEVRVRGRAPALGGAKPRALLAVLLLNANQAVSAERLALALWGEDAPAGAVSTIQVHVSRLRKALGDPGVLTTTAAGYRLRVDDGELDADRFEQLFAEGRRALAAGDAERAAAVLREALSLWRGQPLADVAGLPFAATEIARLEERRMAAIEARAEADLAAGRHAELVAELSALASRHPTRERLHGLLMLALYRGGRQAEALEAYRHAREGLVEQLGIEPGADLRELHQAVLAQDPAIDAPSTPAGPSATVLPVPATALFGREGDLDALLALVREPGTRHVTLVGPGGVGKTRLAIEAARRLADGFADGARFVALAPIAEPREVASAIARAIGAPVGPGEQPEKALLRFVPGRHMLLVLDNFEHLLDGAPVVAGLLAASEELTVVVTSREPIRLAAERVHPVRPLDFPEAATVPAAESERYGAVAMFCDRARARDPGFSLDESSAPHVQEICRRLDGLPLALELAAARSGLLAPAELAARLDRALTVLAGGPRDAPERQRTMRATIDWSFRLLTDLERHAFARMAVFVGGATVHAAETVTGSSLDTLDSLVGKQLLVRRDGRMHMLATVREYALERLAADPDRVAVERRHAEWWLQLAREANPHIVQAGRGPWLARLEAELPNGLAALSGALERGDADLALELAVDLGHFWWRTHRAEEGLPYLEAAVERAGEASVLARARAHLYRARLRGPRRHEGHLDDLRASLALFRACDDAAGLAACLSQLAVAEGMFGDSRLAPQLSDEAWRYAQQAGDAETLGLALSDISLSAGTFEEAARHAPAAIAYLRKTGNLLDLAILCSVTGYFGLAEGHYRESLAWFDQALDAGNRLDNQRTAFFVRGNQALARLFLGELDEAEEAFRDSIAAARETASEYLTNEAVLGLAAVAALRRDPDRAARLAGAARGNAGPERNRAEDTVTARLEEQILAPARERVGAETWDRAEREGASLSVKQALDLALARTRPPADTGSPLGAGATRGADSSVLRSFGTSGD
jgi:predicted ATPase/DNA-binding SARP family transcriptional activator